MASEGSEPGSKQHAGMHLDLCHSKLAAVAACRAHLLARLRLVDAKERLIKAEEDFWQQEAELRDMKEACNHSEELSTPTKRREAPNALFPEQPLSSLVEGMASAALVARDAASDMKECEKLCTLMEMDIRNAGEAVHQKKWEVRAFAREHARAEVQRVPQEMLREILSYLQPDDLVTAGQVCSAWRELVTTDVSLWRHTKLSVDDLCCHTSCRILATAPYLDELRMVRDHHVRYNLEIRKLIIPIGSGAQAILKQLDIRLPWLSALNVVLKNHDVARLIDRRCRLKELFVKYESTKPYVFTNYFVRRSTLIDLRCCDIPLVTLNSILAGHQDTLKTIALVRLRNNVAHPSGTIDLTGCTQLKCFQVDCRLSFSLPPSCDEVQLVLRCKNSQQCVTGCVGCVSLSRCTLGSVTRLHLLAEFCRVTDIVVHLKELDRGWLAALHKVSIYCPELTEAICGEIAALLGRSLDVSRPKSSLIAWQEY